MCSKTATENFTLACWAEIRRLQVARDRAECVLIGAGAGLSTAAGYTYDGKRFQQLFGDFRQAYGFRDMYSGGFFPYPDPESYWAYWSRYILCNRYTTPPKDTYSGLLRLVQDKDYFVLTTNVDHCFQKAGFDKARLFYTQGDYGLFQCSVPCHSATYDNREVVEQMVERQRDLRIPTDLVPRCPICGAPMTMNLRCDDRFVEDRGWHAAARQYTDYLARHKGKRILLLELGVGDNTPGIIKYPFWRLTRQEKQATFASINVCQSPLPPQIRDQSIVIKADIHSVLSAL